MADPDLAMAIEDKVAYFQAITGLDDPDLCSEILSAHNWDLELAVTSLTSPPTPPPAEPNRQPPSVADPNPLGQDLALQRIPAPSGLAWKLITLPFYVVSGGAGLVSGALGLGAWIVGGVLTRSLGAVRLLADASSSASAERLILRTSPALTEAEEFVAGFEREYGRGEGVARINFVVEGFMEALQRSRREFKLLFVYLHSPDHPDTPGFCLECLSVEVVAEFVNANFVAWGGSIRGSEGFKISNTLKASRFPFCAVVMASTDQRIELQQQVEGAKSPEELLFILQQVVEETSPALLGARIEAEERMSNMRLREEQDAAYRAALEADRARESQMKEEQERLEREAAEAERRCKEEEQAQERAACEAAEKEAALARRRQEKAMSLGVEPEKGPDVTQVLVRFPNGERKDRRFHSSSSIKCLYDYVDSLDCLKAEKYSLVSNFPRVSYSPDKHSLSLKEAGLHPQASLFVEPET